MNGSVNALVTGAGGGIGLAIATALAAAGWRVHAADRDPTALSHLPSTVVPHVCDISDAANVDALAAQLEANCEAPALLVNNAGMFRAASCLIPGFDGALFSQAWRDALWDKFSTGAPRRQRQSVERYKIVKRA